MNAGLFIFISVASEEKRPKGSRWVNFYRATWAELDILYPVEYTCKHEIRTAQYEGVQEVVFQP